MQIDKESPKSNVLISEEVSSVLDLFNSKADEIAEQAYRRNLRIEKEVFELRNGESTSIFKEKERIRLLLENSPQNYQPKFSHFFAELGRIANWNDEEKRSFHKPPVAAQTINEIIYGRFPKEVIAHIHSKNPYIKYCTRQHKNYYFLTEEGVVLLEKFIEDAVEVMKSSSSVYEFRVKHFERFGAGFQTELFERYLEYAFI